METNNNKSIAIVGAGFSGLHCAKILTELGYSVEIFEARDRVGGRVHTSLYPVASDKNNYDVDSIPFELGGELIGNNHKTWIKLSKEFDLELEDLDHDDNNIKKIEPIQLGDIIYNTIELIDDLNTRTDSILNKITEESLKIKNPYEPWNESEEIKQLDYISFGFILANKKEEWKIDNDVFQYIKLMFERDNLTSIYKQSYLAILCQINGGGGYTFWDNTENKRCKEGNQLLARKMLTNSKNISINYKSVVDKITTIDDKVYIDYYNSTPLSSNTITSCMINCECKDTDNCCFIKQIKEEKQFICRRSNPFDFVVITIPNNLYKSIEYKPSFNVYDYMLNTGPATKIMNKWINPPSDNENISFNSQSDIYGETWYTPIGFNMFFGGKKTEYSTLELLKSLHNTLNRKKPNESIDHVVVKRIDYANEPFSMAGYSCPIVNEMTTKMRNLQSILKENRIAFAGESCSPVFYGFMEGALESGEKTANRIHDWLLLLSTK